MNALIGIGREYYSKQAWMDAQRRRPKLPIAANVNIMKISMLVVLLAVVVPFALAVVALAMRLQSELSLNQRNAHGLRIGSTVIFAIVGLICLILGNVIGLVLALFIVGRWIHFHMGQNWANQHSAELELIWLLALSMRSEQSLADEVEDYALSVTGTRQRRLMAFADDLQNGVPLQKCLPYELFSRPTALQLQAAVNSDTLPESLAHLAITQGKAIGNQHQDLGYSIVAYPLGLMMVLVGSCGFVMYYIIPKFKKIFEDFGTELPETTKMTIHISDFVVNYWYLMAVPLVALVALFRRHLTSFKHTSESAVAVDLLGQFYVRMHAPEILRSLSTAISSGQTMTRAVKVFAQQPGPRLVQSTIDTFIKRVQQGEAAWDELRQLGILRDSEQKVIESANRAGNLPWVLETLAENLERRWTYRFNLIGAVLHPVMILIVSIPIGYFAIAMFMPLINLLNDLS